MNVAFIVRSWGFQSRLCYESAVWPPASKSFDLSEFLLIQEMETMSAFHCVTGPWWGRSMARRVRGPRRLQHVPRTSPHLPLTSPAQSPHPSRAPWLNSTAHPLSACVRREILRPFRGTTLYSYSLMIPDKKFWETPRGLMKSENRKAFQIELSPQYNSLMKNPHVPTHSCYPSGQPVIQQNVTAKAIL